MPQLDTIYTFMISIWTWFTLYLVVQKIKTIPITKTPKPTPPQNHQKPTLILPWT